MTTEITLGQAVEFAIATERQGREWYESLAGRFDGDAEMREVFARLARDERTHEQQFRDLLARVPAGTGSDGDAADLGVLQAMSISPVFADRGEIDQVASEAGSREKALLRALDMEKATLSYYHAMRDVLGDDPVLREIIAAEKEHVAALMRYLVTDGKFRGLGDVWPR